MSGVQDALTIVATALILSQDALTIVATTLI